MRSARLESLASPAFIAALALLVVNDFALKPLFHNILTGKLSDFAGLFALTLFAAALWPQRRHFAAWVIAVSFTFWKTSYAEPLIESLNAMSPMAFGRTVDLTDLVALPMIPLAVWAAPRLTPWPTPRVLQLALVGVALVAFTATSRARYAARNTIDVTRQATIDEPVLQTFFDEIADESGLRCQVCVPLSEGRVYVPGADSNVHALIVELDGQTLGVTATGHDRERGVRVLARRVRSEIEERFPSLTVIDSTTGPAFEIEGETTIFVVRGLSETDSEQQKATFSSIVDDIARARGLEAHGRYYYMLDGNSPERSSFRVVPALDTDGMLLVKVASRYGPVTDVLHQAVDEELGERLAAAFAPENVTRHVAPKPPPEWIF